jgi:hypothetical protein
MTARALSLVAVAGALGLALLVVAQPRRAWREAAEHSKQLWGGWVLGLVAVGVAVTASRGVGWPSAILVLACCALAVLQPSLLGDLREVRSHVQRNKHRPHDPVPPSGVASMPDLAPIRWTPPGR